MRMKNDNEEFAGDTKLRGSVDSVQGQEPLRGWRFAL